MERLFSLLKDSPYSTLGSFYLWYNKSMNKDLEQIFDDLIKSQNNKGDPYFPDWEEVKYFIDTHFIAKEDCRMFPPQKTIKEMGLDDTVGFNDGNKYWTITRDE